MYFRVVAVTVPCHAAQTKAQGFTRATWATGLACPAHPIPHLGTIFHPSSSPYSQWRPRNHKFCMKLSMKQYQI